MAIREIHELDIGTIFRITLKDGKGVVVDVSSAVTTKEIIMKPPKGPIKVFAASFTTDGVDGKIEYATKTGDLDEVGQWELQVHIVLATGEWRSDIGSFKVHSNL